MSEIEERGIPIEDPAEESDEGEGRSLGPLYKWAGLAAVIIALGLGAFLLTVKVIVPRLNATSLGDKIMNVKETINKKKPPKKLKRGEVVPHPIRGVTVNMSPRGHLVFDLIVEVAYEDALKELITKDYQVQDALITHFSGRNKAELLSSRFHATIRDSMKMIISAILQSAPIDTVYITKYLIQ